MSQLVRDQCPILVGYAQGVPDLLIVKAELVLETACKTEHGKQMLLSASFGAPLSASYFQCLIAQIFHNLAHLTDPLWILFEISCSFGHDVAVHVVWIAAQEIVHQLAERVVLMIICVLQQETCDKGGNKSGDGILPSPR